MGNYDALDAAWSLDGDYYLGNDGDIADNRDDYIQSLQTELRSVVEAEFDDWEFHPDQAADLSDYQGEPNTRETGQKIEKRITSRILARNLVLQQDLSVRVVPVHIYQVLVVISVNAASTPYNRLSPGEPLVTTFLYDTLESSVFFVPTGEEGNYGFQ